MTVMGEGSLPGLISTQGPLVLFPLPHPGAEGRDRAALVGTSCVTRVSPLHTSRPGESTTSLGNLAQCPATLQGENFFPRPH